VLLPVAVRRGRLGALRPRWWWIAALSAVEVILPWLLLSARFWVQSAAEQHGPGPLY
jgi:hypothetical protein